MTSSARRVITAYECACPDPLVLAAGARVAIARRPSEWPGWVWCTAPDGKTGWAPEAWIEVVGAGGVLRRDYTARELTVAAGDAVTVVATESGWAWCRTAGDEEGWMPLGCLEAP